MALDRKAFMDEALEEASQTFRTSALVMEEGV
jgi:hypothetical protein